MNLLHGIQNEARHRCHGFGWAVLALAALLLPLTGCESGPCMGSFQCAKGYTCVTFKTTPVDTSQRCAMTCGVEQDFCADGSYCYCPDSPTKARCFDDKGDYTGVCGG